MPHSYTNPANDYKTQHDRSEHLAINNTFIRRTLARLALHTTARFYKRDGHCIPISKAKILKTGLSIHLTEAATMCYIAQQTSIPVPKIYCSFLYKNRAHIVMERIKGEPLASAWKNLSQDSREKIIAQLKVMIQELRALQPPPSTGVESCVGGSLYDSRLPHGTPRFGPFQTIQDFHRWLRNNLKSTQIGDHVTIEEADEIRNMIAKQEGQWPSPVFTHCDLNPFNILVSADKVVGIIDWEFSGWYPHYWECTTAWFGNQTRTEWQSILHSLLGDYPEEFEMERVRNKWWGEW
ncbi:kinase-like protein [Bimuria novae-zelandiae CBS 107.79]|uniref:Kinase-like protein n=1 Tax=Bimuria novae-zelandiae CBS 107.79 TaxID=1447943 RepID=A0A6A5VBA8_9PLEO|nr:kinase-like protein [Bimuria novae-zelandiae CBS 107.79]